VSEELPSKLPPDPKKRKAKKFKAETIIPKDLRGSLDNSVKNLKEGKASEVVHIDMAAVKDETQVFTVTKKIYSENGRPTKFTKEFAEKYVSLIKEGYTYGLAAQACGVDATSVIRYRQLSEEYDANQNPELELFASFAKQVKQAEAAYHGKFIKLLENRADLGDTKAIQFHLERRVAADYGQKNTVNIDNSQHLHLSDESVKQLTDAWIKKASSVDNKQVIDLIDDVKTSEPSE
jgi:hypothetical protein